MEPQNGTYLWNCIERGDLPAAMRIVPWACYPGPKNCGALVAVALGQIEDFSKEHYSRLNRSLLQFVERHLKQLPPNFCGQVALGILANFAGELGLKNSSQCLNNFAEQVISWNSKNTVPETCFFVQRLLELEKNPLISEAAILRFLKRNASDGSGETPPSFDLLVIYALLKIGPQGALSRNVRKALLQTWPQTADCDLSRKTVAFMRERAFSGFWRMLCRKHVGVGVLYADLKESLGKYFPFFIKTHGEMLGFPLLTIYPQFTHDFILQLQALIPGINYDSCEDWDQLAFLFKKTKTKSEQMFELLHDLYLGVKEQGEKFERFKKILLLWMEQHLGYLQWNSTKRGCFVEMVRECDQQNLLYQKDISQITHTFHTHSHIPSMKYFYYECVYPFLMKYRHPQDSLPLAINLLRERTFDELCCCIDFPNFYTPDVIPPGNSSLPALLSHDLGFSLTWIRSPNLERALDRFHEHESPLELYEIYYHLLRDGDLQRIFLRRSTAVVDDILGLWEVEDQQSEESSYPEQCKQAVVQSAYFECLLSILSVGVPAEKSELSEEEYRPLQTCTREFIRFAYTKLTVRHDFFIRKLLRLQRKVPWLLEGFKHTFAFPPDDSHADREAEEQQQLLCELDRVGLLDAPLHRIA